MINFDPALRALFAVPGLSWLVLHAEYYQRVFGTVFPESVMGKG